MNNLELISISNNSNEKSISLAEILANFALRRPLYIHESSALCYQILEEFHLNLIENNANEAFVLNLTYPTLGNIEIEQNGIAFVTKTQSKYRASDWLVAFSETLKSHTLWNPSPESNTFRTLIENFTNCSLIFDHLVEQVHIWRKTCLYLCSLVQIPEDMTDKLLLKELRTRSEHAQSCKLFSHEIQTKSLKYSKLRSNVSPPLDNNVVPVLDGDSIQLQCQKSYVQEEKEAFAKWIEKWQCVNAEFSAQQIIGNSLVKRKSDRLEPRYHRQLWSFKLPSTSDSEMKDNQSNDGDKCEPIGSESVDLENNTSKPLETNDANSSTYMDALRNMYSTLITRPLNLLKRGLKESSIGNKTISVHNDYTNSTLKKLEQVLQKSDSG